MQERPLLPASEQWKALERKHVRLEKWLPGDSPLRLVHELLVRDRVDVSLGELGE